MKYPFSYRLETERCYLRSPSKNDIPAIFKAAQVDGFTDGMLWDPPSCEDELIKPYESNISAWKDDRAYCFSIMSKAEEEFIGRISIRKQVEMQEGIWDLGFFIVPEHQGNQYMTEVVRAVLGFGFNELNAHKIIAAHAVWNVASEKVLKKNGMMHLEFKPRAFQKRGEWIDENLLGISQVEWKQLNQINLE